MKNCIRKVEQYLFSIEFNKQELRGLEDDIRRIYRPGKGLAKKPQHFINLLLTELNDLIDGDWGDEAELGDKDLEDDDG